jgi:hypothetical protein
VIKSNWKNDSLIVQTYFSVLKNILEEDIRTVDKAMMSKDNYQMGAWEFFQADQIGSKRTLIKLLELIP